jgi:hypothetical protein
MVWVQKLGLLDFITDPYLTIAGYFLKQAGLMSNHPYLGG